MTDNVVQMMVRQNVWFAPDHLEGGKIKGAKARQSQITGGSSAFIPNQSML